MQDPPTEQTRLPENMTTETDPCPPSDDRVARERELNIRMLWRASCVPERHKVAAKPAASLLDDADVSPWGMKFKQLAARLGEGVIVVLHGARGTGKTQLACNLVRESCIAEVPALYATAIGFFLEVRESFVSATDSERSVIQRYVSPGLLVIDEVHERGNTPWEDRLLSHLVDERYAMMRSTVLISNEVKEGVAQNLGPSITDRVRECGWFVECDWPSFREGVRQ